MLYEQAAEEDGYMPTWDEMLEQGVYKRPVEPGTSAFEAFRTDPAEEPAGHPVRQDRDLLRSSWPRSPRTWELEEGEVINPIPVFHARLPRVRFSVTDEFPLYCCGLPSQEPHPFIVRLHPRA